MASLSSFRSLTRSDLSLCARCAFRASNACSRNTRRWHGNNSTERAVQADVEWQTRAREINGGKQKSMLTKLEERGLVLAVTGSRDEVDKMMTEKRVGAYVGIDPTASSLHVGHMLPLMALFWMYVHGYPTISLLGGATAKIGDPTGRLTTREDTKKSIRTQNLVQMHNQLRKLWLNVEAYAKKYGYKSDWASSRGVLNNDMWMESLTLMDFLQVLGTGMRMGSMLARDTVKNKMKNGDGMSFAEFSYPLLQAWDWWQMYKDRGIQMQIGGSDQYGNITAGIDAIKHISAKHSDPAIQQRIKTRGAPLGITVPLLTTSSGQKFGKSAGNAIWLDLKQTSSFELYKFFLGTSDADVGTYLKLFTFMPVEQIDTLVKEHMQAASQRKAQQTLAREFVELIHGEQEAQHAESQHRLIYAKNTMSPKEYVATQVDFASTPRLSTAPDPESLELSHTEGSQSNRPRPHIKLPRSAIEHANIGRILLTIGLTSSASEGHRLANRGSVYVGSLIGGPEGGKSMFDVSLFYIPIKAWSIEDVKKYMVNDTLLIFRRGKHSVKIVEVVSDCEYEELGLTYPGMKTPISEDEELATAS